MFFPSRESQLWPKVFPLDPDRSRVRVAAPRARFQWLLLVAILNLQRHAQTQAPKRVPTLVRQNWLEFHTIARSRRTQAKRAAQLVCAWCFMNDCCLPASRLRRALLAPKLKVVCLAKSPPKFAGGKLNRRLP